MFYLWLLLPILHTFFTCPVIPQSRHFSLTAGQSFRFIAPPPMWSLSASTAGFDISPSQPGLGLLGLSLLVRLLHIGGWIYPCIGSKNNTHSPSVVSSPIRGRSGFLTREMLGWPQNISFLSSMFSFRSSTSCCVNFKYFCSMVTGSG